MKIIVCINHVPDTETKIKVGADGTTIDPSGVNYMLSPYDEFALEEGTVLDGTLRLKTLYNKRAVCRHFPDIDEDALEDEVQATVERAIDEHLAMSGFSRG